MAGRLPEAEQHFMASLAVLPGRASTLVNLAATRVLLGRPEEALTVADQALAMDPDMHDAWLHRATALAGLSRHAEALTSFERALSIDSGQSEVWSRQAQTLLALNRHDDAFASYERALTLNPASSEIWSRYGEALRESMRLAEAAQAFEQAIAHGGDPELHGYLLASVGGAAMPPHAPKRYVQALFDGYADDFDQHLVGVLGYDAHRVLTRHLALLARGPFDSALDLGCGTGLCGPLVKPHVRHLTGVDLSAAMLAKAGTLGVYSELVQGDLVSHLRATQRRYDLVLAADVFIYVGELDGVFSAVSDATLPGAVFCFSAEVPPTAAAPGRPKQGQPPRGAESDTQCANVGATYAPGRPKQGQPQLPMQGAESRRRLEQSASVGAIFPGRGRGTGSAGPQAQRPPRGAESDTQCANVGAQIQGVQLLPSLRYAHSEGYLRRLAAQHGFDVLDILRQPVRHDQRQPIDGLYLYLVKA